MIYAQGRSIQDLLPIFLNYFANTGLHRDHGQSRIGRLQSDPRVMMQTLTGTTVFQLESAKETILPATQPQIWLVHLRVSPHSPRSLHNPRSRQALPSVPQVHIYILRCILLRCTLPRRAWHRLVWFLACHPVSSSIPGARQYSRRASMGHPRVSPHLSIYRRGLLFCVASPRSPM